MIKEFETAMLCVMAVKAERYRNIGDLVAGEKECMDTERPLGPELEAMIERECLLLKSNILQLQISMLHTCF